MAPRGTRLGSVLCPGPWAQRSAHQCTPSRPMPGTASVSAGWEPERCFLWALAHNPQNQGRSFVGKGKEKQKHCKSAQGSKRRCACAAQTTTLVHVQRHMHSYIGFTFTALKMEVALAPRASRSPWVACCSSRHVALSAASPGFPERLLAKPSLPLWFPTEPQINYAHKGRQAVSFMTLAMNDGLQSQP